MNKQNGFTLLEMMVALCVFAITGLIGWQVMESTSKTQVSVTNHIYQSGETQRIFAVLQNDLQAAISVPANAGGVQSDVWFSAEGSTVLLNLLRYPLDPVANSPAHIVWKTEAGILRRYQWRYGLSSTITPPVVTMQFNGQVKLRFWQGQKWITGWSQPDRMPEAAEIILTHPLWGEVRKIVLMGGEDA